MSHTETSGSIPVTGIRYSGHGTYTEQELVIASVAGTIERVNKLVTVRAARTRYVSILAAQFIVSYRIDTHQRWVTW